VKKRLTSIAWLYLVAGLKGLRVNGEKMKLVEFKDGTFGVRNNWFFGWHFIDLRSNNFDWTRSSKYFSNCKGSREIAEQTFMMRGSKYKIIKLSK